MILIRNKFLFFHVLLILTVVQGCREAYTPKPRAYFRIDLPAKEYRILEGEYPYRFELPVYSEIKKYSGKWSLTDTAEYWINVEYPRFHGRLHLTYKPVGGDLASLIEDAHTFVFKHSVKADAINQQEYENPENKVYGVLFDIKGNTASSLQFYMTDSVSRFLRGALYFDHEPNKDSIAPVNEFIRQDIVHLIETLSWNTQAK